MTIRYLLVLAVLAVSPLIIGRIGALISWLLDAHERSKKEESNENS